MIWPAGLDRSVIHALPLKLRTRNCLHGNGLVEGSGPITAKELLQLPNFGPVSLEDLLTTVEAFLKECVRTAPEEASEHGGLSGGLQSDPRGINTPMVIAETPRAPWEKAEEFLIPLLASTAELHGAETLADVLSPDLVRLADKMGIADRIRAIRIEQVVKSPSGLVSVVLNRVSEFIDNASETELSTIENRLLRTPPMTLAEIGSQVGLTRERIRQVQLKIERRLQTMLGDEGRIIASEIREGLGNLAHQEEIDRRIETLFPPNLNFPARLIRKALIDEMGFYLDDGVYFNERAIQELKGIKVTITGFADDVGLVNERQVLANLPSEEWRQLWPWVCRRVRLLNLNGILALRDSFKARVKAALLSIGHPATREEIAAISGIEESRVGSHLSNVQSVVRADKERWGLSEWIDDAYDGIVGEMIQRIEEDGGVTTVERLLTELPSKFDVSPISVRAYMQTPKFLIRDGWISVADTSSIQLRDLDDVIDGRDADGFPYWTFVVEARYLDGYSVVGVPFEVAKALGCNPDEGDRLRVENLSEHHELSIRWKLASTTGASIGYLAKPLRQLGLEPGQRARLTIKGPRTVDLTADRHSAEQPFASEADAILDGLMRRPKIL